MEIAVQNFVAKCIFKYKLYFYSRVQKASQGHLVMLDRKDQKVKLETEVHTGRKVKLDNL